MIGEPLATKVGASLDDSLRAIRASVNDTIRAIRASLWAGLGASLRASTRDPHDR